MTLIPELQKYSPEREAIDQYYHMTVGALERSYGVTNLTDLEKLQIRKDIEESLKLMSYIESEKPEAADYTVNHPAVEAVHKFLDFYNIPRDKVKHWEGKAKEALKELIRRRREEAHKPYLD